MVAMTDIDLPLDAIISSKRIRLDGNGRLTSGGRVAGGAIVKAKAIVPKRMSAPTIVRTVPKTAEDARNHIIQRKRLNLTDARDQLGLLAKTTDVRAKLNKLKGGQQKAIVTLKAEPSKPFDIRQKLNQQRGTSGQQANKNLQPRAKTGLQTVSNGTGAAKTLLLRTVSTNNNKPQQQKVNKISSYQPVQQAQSLNRNRSSATLVTVRNTVPVQRRQPQLQHVQVGRRRMVNNAPVYATRPRQIVTQPVYRRPVVVQQSPRPTMVSRRQTMAPEIVYEDELVMQDEEYYVDDDGMDYVDAGQQQPVYYEERSPSPEYQEYTEDIYIPQSAPIQQQQYGPAPPPLMQRQQQYSSNSFVSQPQQMQPQQRMQPSQRMQPQQRMQPMQQQQRMQPMQQQQRMQPMQQQQRMQPMQQQQRMQPMQQQQRMQPMQQQQRMQPMQHYPMQQRSQPMQQRSQPMQQRSQPMQQRSQPMQQRSQPMQQRIQHQSAQKKTRPGAPTRQHISATPKAVGTSVSVGNLHHVATHEDIEELFGNIGATLSSKMTKPGHAVVVFQNLADARKSVEVYHNRKLDGQPMQVKIMGPMYDSPANRLGSKY